MTKDLALLVGDTQGWLTTEGFLDKVAANLEKALGQGLADDDDAGQRPCPCRQRARVAPSRPDRADLAAQRV
jgi:hypothetical protein